MQPGPALYNKAAPLWRHASLQRLNRMNYCSDDDDKPSPPTCRRIQYRPFDRLVATGLGRLAGNFLPPSTSTTVAARPGLEYGPRSGTCYRGRSHPTDPDEWKGR